VQCSDSRHLFFAWKRMQCMHCAPCCLPCSKVLKRSMHCISNTIVIRFAALPLLLMLSTLCHTGAHKLCSPLYLNLHSPFVLPLPSPLPFVWPSPAHSPRHRLLSSATSLLAKIPTFINGSCQPSCSHILLLLYPPPSNNLLFRSVSF
jgi:hypothetical protein